MAVYQLSHFTNHNMHTQFAHDLRLARRKAGFIQRDIAHLLSTHQSVVSSLEHGQQRPTLEQILDLSLIYGRSFESLFTELLAERTKILKKRLVSLPTLSQPTAHTFNRTGSIARLNHRLRNQKGHGRA